jgi:isochorismate synthase
MILSTLHKSAIENALKFGLSFALFRDKGSDDMVFICDDGEPLPLRSEKTFFAVNWLEKFATRQQIRDRLSLAEAAGFKSDKAYAIKEPWQVSSLNSEYHASVGMLIDELNESGGKVVVSRTIAAPLQDTIANVTEQYFEINNSAYCCLLHTPQVGCWLIASPELLLSANLQSHVVETVALAGTRACNSTGSWDNKNVIEQEIVRDFIVNAFRKLHFDCRVTDKQTVKANNVEHIATAISSEFNEVSDIEKIIDELNPTPALCGMPRDFSIEKIRSIEQHPRRLYGGYFGFSDREQFKAIVTLRCAQLSKTNACIYAGGGITALSCAQAEWAETTLKAQGLTKIIIASNNENR